MSHSIILHGKTRCTVALRLLGLIDHAGGRVLALLRFLLLIPEHRMLVLLILTQVVLVSRTGDAI